MCIRDRVWPLSFEALIRADEPLFVACHEWTVAEDGKPGIDLHSYTFEPDSPEYEAIVQILAGYSYRRCWRTFIGDNVLDGKNPGYSLQLYSGENSVVLVGTGEIDVNTRIYRMGLFTGRRSQAMMAEIRAVLDGAQEDPA